MEHDSVIRKSLIDISDTLHRSQACNSEEPILESYIHVRNSQLNIQKARKEIEQNYIIKKAIHDELNI